MATEKYIHGKHDDAHHEGKRSTIRRIAETDEEIIEFWKEVWPELWESQGDLEDDQPRDTALERQDTPPPPQPPEENQ